MLHCVPMLCPSGSLCSSRVLNFALFTWLWIPLVPFWIWLPFWTYCGFWPLPASTSRKPSLCLINIYLTSKYLELTWHTLIIWIPAHLSDTLDKRYGVLRNAYSSLFYIQPRTIAQKIKTMRLLTEKQNLGCFCFLLDLHLFVTKFHYCFYY